MSEFSPISSRMAPLITAPAMKPLSDTFTGVMPVEPSARMTGKYSGLAPAMTALTAASRTV